MEPLDIKYIFFFENPENTSRIAAFIKTYYYKKLKYFDILTTYSNTKVRCKILILLYKQLPKMCYICITCGHSKLHIMNANMIQLRKFHAEHLLHVLMFLYRCVLGRIGQLWRYHPITCFSGRRSHDIFITSGAQSS